MVLSDVVALRRGERPQLLDNRLCLVAHREDVITLGQHVVDIGGARQKTTRIAPQGTALRIFVQHFLVQDEVVGSADPLGEVLTWVITSAIAYDEPPFEILGKAAVGV